MATLQGGYQPAAVDEAAHCVLAGLGSSDRAETGTGTGGTSGVAAGAAAMAHAERVEAVLDDEQQWWSVERSFDHGLGGSDEEEGNDGDCGEEGTGGDGTT